MMNGIQGGALKYFNKRRQPAADGVDRIFRPEDHQKLHWPGTEAGYPLKADVVPDLKKEELDQVQHCGDFHSRRFELWKDEDKKAYSELMDRVVNGMYRQLRRDFDTVMIPTKMHIDGDERVIEVPHKVVYVEWAMIYGMLPPHLEAKAAGQ